MVANGDPAFGEASPYRGAALRRWLLRGGRSARSWRADQRRAGALQLLVVCRPRSRWRGPAAGGRTATGRPCRTTTWQVTPPWRQRVATSPTILPASVWSSRRPSPVTTKARGAHGVVEADRVEHVGRARLQLRAVVGPQAARQPAGGAGHRHSARVARGVLGQLLLALLQPLHRVRVGALLGAEHARGVLERCVARRTARRASGSPRPRRAPRRRRRRRRWWPMPPTVTSTRLGAGCRPRPRSARPCPPEEAAKASRSSSATSPRPLAWAASTTAVLPSGSSTNAASTGRPSGSLHAHGPALAAEHGVEHVHGALAAVGHRQLHRIAAGRRSPPATARGHFGGRHRALEGVGRDEDRRRAHSAAPERLLGLAAVHGEDDSFEVSRRGSRAASTISSATSSSGKPPTPAPKATRASERQPSSSALVERGAGGPLDDLAGGRPAQLHRGGVDHVLRRHVAGGGLDGLAQADRRLLVGLALNLVPAGPADGARPRRRRA